MARNCRTKCFSNSHQRGIHDLPEKKSEVVRGSRGCYLFPGGASSVILPQSGSAVHHLLWDSVRGDWDMPEYRQYYRGAVLLAATGTGRDVRDLWHGTRDRCHGNFYLRSQ